MFVGAGASVIAFTLVSVGSCPYVFCLYTQTFGMPCSNVSKVL